jgi:hypothetical protein
MKTHSVPTILLAQERFDRPGHPAWCLALATIVALAFPAAGCRHSSRGASTSQAAAGNRPTFDVSGGDTNTDLLLGIRIPIEGIGGAGGEIHILSIVGTVELHRRARTFFPPIQTLTGVGGLVVAQGQARTLNGGHNFTFVYIEPGGELFLEGNTTFIVTGDVRIDGNVFNKTSGAGRFRNGPEFNIFAGGSVVLRGKIDVSGAPGVDEEGGDGGRLWIVAGTAADTADEDILVVTGALDAKGGSTESQNAAESRAGTGGSIRLGSYGRALISGRLNARAGKSIFNNVSTGVPGGDIDIAAVGDVLIEEVTELNASGGESSGSPGSGGVIVVTSANNALVLEGPDIENRGGDATFTDSITAGTGGRVALNGATVTIINSKIRAHGGFAEEDVESTGGAGGTVSITGSTTIDCDAEVEILVQGGDTLFTLTDGGDGGNFLAVSLDDAGSFSYDGRVDIRGGKNSSRNEGAGGNYCATNIDSAATLANVIGTNSAPLSACSSASVEGLVAALGEIDNDDATVRPDSTVTELETLPYRLLRVFPLLGQDMEVTLDGEETGSDLDLYIVDGDLLDDVQTGAITLVSLIASAFDSSANAPGAGSNDESVTVTSGSLGGIINAQGFFLVLVVERNGVPSTFTLGVE